MTSAGDVEERDGPHGRGGGASFRRKRFGADLVMLLCSRIVGYSLQLSSLISVLIDYLDYLDYLVSLVVNRGS